jgi:hypothetical protein
VTFLEIFISPRHPKFLSASPWGDASPTLGSAELAQRDKNNKSTKFKGFWFYDFETFCDDETGVHTVCLAMAQRVCLLCLDKEERCNRCIKVRTFYNISDFCDFLLCKRQEHFVFICHNSKGEF